MIKNVDKISRSRHTIINYVLLFMFVFFLFTVIFSPLISYAQTAGTGTPTTPATTDSTPPTTTSTPTSGGIKMEPLHEVLVTNTNIKKVWTQVRNGVNYLVIAVLIFISFANILRIDLNNYAIKKFLPTLIMGIILANFSYFICRILVDFANIIMDLLMNGVVDEENFEVGVAGAFNFTSEEYFPVDPNNLNRSFVFILGEFVGAIAILILAFMFFIRNYVIYFLVGIAPLAFMATILPQAKNLFNKWWTMYLQWVFLPVISLFWLWIGGMWYGSGFTGAQDMSGMSSARNNDFNSATMALAFGLVCYYLAIITPIKSGGAIMGKWSDLGKKAPGYLNKQWGGIAGRTSLAGQNLKARYQDEGSWQHRLGKGLDAVGGWTNIPAMQKAYKSGKSGFYAQIDKASLKTSGYRKFAGQAGRIEGAQKKLEDDLEYMTAGESARDMTQIEGQILAAVSNPTDRGSRNFRITLDNKLRDFGGFDGAQGTAVGQQRTHELIRQILATEGPSNLLLKFRGVGGILNNEEDAVRVEGTTRNANRFLRNTRTREDFRNEYGFTLPTSAVPADTTKAFEELAQKANESATSPSATSTQPTAQPHTSNQQPAQGPVASSSAASSSSEPFAQPVGTSAPGASTHSASASHHAKLSDEEVRLQAKKASEMLERHGDEQVAQGMKQHDTDLLNISAKDVNMAAKSAGMTVPASAYEEIARIASKATMAAMSTADQIRSKTSEAAHQANSEAMISSKLMDQLASTPQSQQKVSDLLKLAREGREQLSQGGYAGLGDATAAAQLIVPDSGPALQALLEGSNRGDGKDQEKLRQQVSRIFETTEKEMGELEGKNGAIISEKVAEYKNTGPSEWQKQYVLSHMEDVPQQAHREVIIERIPSKLEKLPDNADHTQVEATMAEHFNSLIASNADLSDALSRLPDTDKEKVLNSTKEELKTVVNSQIVQMQNGQQLTPAELKNAYISAFTDPKVVKQSASQTGKALDNSLRATNDLLAKNSSSEKQIHDITPPSVPSSGGTNSNRRMPPASSSGSNTPPKPPTNS